MGICVDVERDLVGHIPCGRITFRYLLSGVLMTELAGCLPMHIMAICRPTI
jgi:hypothetical protein